MATIHNLPRTWKPSSAQLSSAPDPAPGVWVVSGPRRHQEAAGIHGEAGQWGSSILTSEL